MRIVSDGRPHEVEVKRFYIPGTSLKGNCPKCKKPAGMDFGDDYLSYPTANEPFEYSCYCRNCDHNWTVTLRLEVKLSIVEGKDE